MSYRSRHAQAELAGRPVSTALACRRLLVAADHRGTPVFLAASSWAAKLAVVYAAQRPAPLAGLLLLGPGLTAEVKLSPARLMQVVVGHLIAPTACLPISP